MTTVFTASRCEGLATRDRCMRPPLNVGRSYDVPRWYLTSPDPVYCDPPSVACPAGFGPALNSLKMLCNGLRTTFANTLSRPRWGMPIVSDSTPSSEALSMASLNPGIRVSHPSSPNRFAAVYLLLRKFSNISDHARRSSKTFFRSLEYSSAFCVSILSRNQLHLSRSWMCMYSYPMLPQYVSRSLRKICRSVCTGLSSDRKPFMRQVPKKNSRSRSCSVNPYSAGSSSTGTAFTSRFRGSKVDMECPFTWYARTNNSRRMDSWIVCELTAPDCAKDAATGAAPPRAALYISESSAPVTPESICRRKAAHEGGTELGSARKLSSTDSRYAADVPERKSSCIAALGVGALPGGPAAAAYGRGANARSAASTTSSRVAEGFFGGGAPGLAYAGVVDGDASDSANSGAITKKPSFASASAKSTRSKRLPKYPWHSTATLSNEFVKRPVSPFTATRTPGAASRGVLLSSHRGVDSGVLSKTRAIFATEMACG
mmetsp:Transcript_11153/g.47575  ORF Transcript_11153/g.47575 Transcript_11153/m.47575 type:complete len:488 (-) Transcript_11153:233-1696(-)